MAGGMNPGISFRLGKPERRLGLMRELAGALAQAQAALLASDGEELQIQTERERTLCRTLQSFPPEATNPRRQCSQELRELGLQIRDLNLVQAALLRRARRSLEILACLRARCAPTYTAPGTERNPLTP